MLGRYASYLVSLFSMMILARIFTPDIFGTVAAIMVFFTFFQLMAEAGLGPAIININRLESADRDGLFGLTLFIGFVLALLFLLLGPIFVAFYEMPRVDKVVPYIAVSLLFFAGSIIPTAFLLREQAFFRIANVGIAAEIISTSFTIGLVQLVDPLHALAAKATVNAVARFFISWYFSINTEFGSPMPGRKFSAIKPLLGFCGYQFGFNFINYFSRNLDNILIGKYLGAELLGAYDKSYQLMRYPLMLLTSAMTPAVQPVIRKYSGDPVQVESIHRDFTFKLSLVGAVAGLAMFALADWLVLIILGNQWLGVIPIIQILAIAIPAQVVLSTCGSFFQAMNSARTLFLSGAFSAVFTVGAIVIGILYRNIEILCWCLVGAFHINFVQAYYYMYKKVFKAPLYLHLINMIPASIVVVGMIGWSLWIIN
ncbi:hypothetical protein E5Q11_06605 [Marinobacter confluentis]|uniref:Lipopolysaccharide biosynthesis protein n=2 Tax=Marinobacter confluentis TaxID=1697557 RepID=A0A4Z1CHA7_9GAMM|nr:hypothetical protein E5Q11_06605 [Marinobacter confluentis]